MRIFAWRAPAGNVGDDLNHWLWPKVFGSERTTSPEATLIGIGSILDRRFDETPGLKIVFGAGSRGKDNLPDINAADWRIVFVRGPLTAKALNLEAEHWISDPAILAPRFLGTAKAKVSHNPQKIGFIPYFGTDPLYSQMIARIAGFVHIPAHLSPERFVEHILSCDLVFCEAMHGAILSDAYGVPWAPCWISNHLTEGATTMFKWRDWAESLELKVSPLILPNWSAEKLRPSNTATLLLKSRKAATILTAALRHPEKWQLSNRELLKERQDRMLKSAEYLLQTL